MTTAQVKLVKKFLKEEIKKNATRSKSARVKRLQEVGILNNKGNLHRNYGG